MTPRQTIKFSSGSIFNQGQGRRGSQLICLANLFYQSQYLPCGLTPQYYLRAICYILIYTVEWIRCTEKSFFAVVSGLWKHAVIESQCWPVFLKSCFWILVRGTDYVKILTCIFGSPASGLWYAQLTESRHKFVFLRALFRDLVRRIDWVKTLTCISEVLHLDSGTQNWLCQDTDFYHSQQAIYVIRVLVDPK